MATAQQQAKSDEEQKSPPRPVREIQSDIARTRARLVGNIEQLKAETTPKALGARAQAKGKMVVLKEDGSVRVERVAAVAGVLIGLILLRKGMKSRSRHRQLKQLAEVVWVPVPRNAVNPELVAVTRNASELAPLTEEYAPALALTSG